MHFVAYFVLASATGPGRVKENVRGKPGAFFYANVMLGLCIFFYIFCIFFISIHCRLLVLAEYLLLNLYVAGLIAFIFHLLWIKAFILKI